MQYFGSLRARSETPRSYIGLPLIIYASHVGHSYSKIFIFHCLAAHLHDDEHIVDKFPVALNQKLNKCHHKDREAFLDHCGTTGTVMALE